jgi:hypothetical protein
MKQALRTEVRLAVFGTLYQSHPLRVAGIIDKCGGVGRAIIAANNIADPANLTSYKALILPHCMRPATCANGTYPDETLGYDAANTDHSTCRPCALGCEACTDQKTCTACALGYRLGSDGACVACDWSCAACSDAETCDVCHDGFYRQFDGACVRCMEGCRRCPGTATCDVCFQGYTLTNGNTACQRT